MATHDYEAKIVTLKHECKAAELYLLPEFARLTAKDLVKEVEQKDSEEFTS